MEEPKMKKRIITLALAFMMCLALVPMTVLAADVPTKFDAPVISDLSVYISDDDVQAGFEFTIVVPVTIKNAIDYYANHERGYNQVGYVSSISGEYAVDGGNWQELGITNGGSMDEGARISLTSSDISAEKTIKFRVKFTGWDENIGDWESAWSNVLTLNDKIDLNTSDWAKPEIEKADALGLIPDSLKGADLTKPITRAEFAAVAVKVFENLSGTKAIPAITNPFTDTKDTEVLKAYNANIMVGTAADKFSPDVLLNREQCATALTRVFKRVTMPGWTLDTDANFALSYTKSAPFADDAKISGWAKDSVYFMAANGVIAGTGNNMFSPRATTSDEEARGYAQATREQAIVIAVRMVQKLGA
jgi:hypothetical protein